MPLEPEKLDKNFDRVKQDAEAYYSSVSEVYCPYFNEAVAFNAKGLKHIKFKKDGVARSRSDQFMRLKHLRFAQRILEKSKTLQEYKESKVFEEVKSDQRKGKILQDAHFYGFTAIIADGDKMKRLKIVVKQVGGGKKYFWSIIPFWTRNKELMLHSGNPEED
ncbi:MAG: hypothetical protein P4M11_07390 [Candidatus Pacebacteria bacterium]|nr:hypothetical protein [Candidatus Paceibacterota bacterium]